MAVCLSFMIQLLILSRRRRSTSLWVARRFLDNRCQCCQMALSEDNLELLVPKLVSWPKKSSKGSQLYWHFFFNFMHKSTFFTYTRKVNSNNFLFEQKNRDENWNWPHGVPDFWQHWLMLDIGYILKRGKNIHDTYDTYWGYGFRPRLTFFFTRL